MASTFVLFALIFVGLAFRGSWNSWRGLGDIVSGLLLSVVVILVIFAIGAGGAMALGVVHRRLAALAALPLYLFAAAIGVIGCVYGSMRLLGLAPLATGTQISGVWLALPAFFVATGITLEGIGWAWWQLRTSREQFLAARGWRSPPWRVISSVRQILGLPSFISNFGRGRLGLTLTYVIVAVINIGLVGAAIAPPALLVGSTTNIPANALAENTFGIAILGLLALNAIGLGGILQRMASRQATRLYQQAREWDVRPPIVFLRAFDQDASKLRARSLDPFVRFPAGCGAARTIDELLLENASMYGPVIAIGDPRDPTPPLGAARIFVPGDGNEWQHVVHSLLAASNAVVMCPSTSEGVKWELDLIADAIGRLKVIFIANPTLPREQTLMLFQRLSPPGQMPALAQGQYPLGAYLDKQGRWCVMTTKYPPSVQTFSVALNYALQALLGMRGVALRRPKKARSRRGDGEAAVATTLVDTPIATAGFGAGPH